jgi:amino acid adenylation domain-containing protein
MYRSGETAATVDPVSLMLVRHAEDRPDAPAVKDDLESLTYSQLRERAVAFASGLVALGVSPDDRVALQLPNSSAFVTAALGCLWLGAAFVPLSVDDPQARVARILDDCDPRLIVSRDPVDQDLGDAARRVVDVAAVLSLDGGAPPRSEDPGRDAYLIYTSGTTGTPKGVRIPASAFGWAISTTAQMIGLDSSTRALCVSPFHFDGSYGNLFPPLVAGGRIVIPPREELLFVKRFYRSVLEEEITHTGFSPSYLRLILSSPRLPTLAESRLRTLGLGGEECVARDLAHLWDVVPDLRVFNYYGPTETTIELTTYEVDKSDLGLAEVPFGPPHPGVDFYLVDKQGKVVEAAGEIGELYVGGRQLMSGYLGDEELTASVLRTDVIPGQKVYKTGDLVRRDDRGRYVFAGRSDDVVKRRGVRTSLAEISRVVRSVDTVSRAVCLPVDIGGAMGLACFVEAGLDMTVSRILEATSAQLPASMIPDEFFIVQSLPMTSSGKIDRDALLSASGRKSWQRE